MRFSELKNTLAKGIIKTFYLLTGDDEFLKTIAQEKITAIIEMPQLNVTHLESPSAQELRNALIGMPLLSERRLIIVDNVTDVMGLEDLNWGNNILLVKNPPKSKKGKGDKKESGITRFFDRAEKIDCAPTEEIFLIGWIANEARKYNTQIDRETAELLCGYCKNYLSRISNEFAKLASYRYGGKITEADVRALVKKDSEFAVWELSKAISSKNGKKAMEIYYSFSDDEKKPEVLFGLLQNHFRKLYYALTEKDTVLTNILGLKSNVIYATRNEARKFGAEKLERIIRELARIDEDVKSSVLPRSTASENMIMRILSEV